MKRKVNINREKISSGEIESRRNFSSLVKNYAQVGNPFRRTSWRTKGLLWVIIASAVLVYIVNTEHGCNEHEIYREYNKNVVAIQAGKLSFAPQIEDISVSYKIKLVLRHVDGIRFKELNVKMSFTSPSGKNGFDDYLIKEIPDETEQFKDRSGDICDLELLIATEFRFNETGKYDCVVETSFPPDDLSSIQEVGLVIEKNP